MFSRAWWRLVGLLFIGMVAVGCGAGAKVSGGGSVFLHGVVTERAEGFSERPEWAEPNQPWARNKGKLSVIGYVAIGGDQRIELGHRAADSYARAELLRFLSTNVVAVLEDKTDATSTQYLRERLIESASAFVDDWTVAARYWEKRRDGSEEKLHIFSRLDVDLASVGELLKKASEGEERLNLPALAQKLDARWEDLSSIALNEGKDGSSGGTVPAPVWAKPGDTEDGDGFSFVCRGSGPDEKAAIRVARTRCNEKLCRLFGVRISSKLTVTETLEGTSAESQVSEQCEVLDTGRKTTNQGGECSESGCLYWVKQTYPRSSYLVEKERLSQPTVIQQQVVIQEGGVRYRDPKACESSLRSYQAVEGLTADAFQSRVQFLRQSLTSCQGIDGRDAGLNESLNILLLNRVSNFIYEKGRYTGPDAEGLGFVRVPEGWTLGLRTKRFLTDRIGAILKVCEDAVFPMQLFEQPRQRRKQPISEEERKRAFALQKQLLQLPFGDEPLKPTHLYNVHRIMLDEYWGARPPLSPAYHTFLIEQLKSGKVRCDEGPGAFGRELLDYLDDDGVLDSEEWNAGLVMIQVSPKRSVEPCVHSLLTKNTPPAELKGRIDTLAELILSQKVRNAPSAKDQKEGEVELMDELLDALPPEQRLAVYLRFRTRLVGESKALKRIREKVVEANFKSTQWSNQANESERAACESLASRLGPVLEAAPELSVEDTSVCSCMALDLPSGIRSALRGIWLKYTDLECRQFRAEELPEPEVVWPYPKRSWGGDGPFRRIDTVLEAEEAKCRDAIPIWGLRTTPLFEGTLSAGKISDVKVSVRIDGKLSGLEWREGRRRWVKKRDVEEQVASYAACLKKAAEGYSVLSEDLVAKDPSPRRFWHEIGDQGSFNGYGSYPKPKD